MEITETFFVLCDYISLCIIKTFICLHFFRYVIHHSRYKHRFFLSQLSEQLGIFRIGYRFFKIGFRLLFIIFKAVIICLFECCVLSITVQNTRIHFTSYNDNFIYTFVRNTSVYKFHIVFGYKLTCVTKQIYNVTFSQKVLRYSTS